MTIVMQRVRRRRPGDARNGAQIRVDGQEVVVRHALKNWPGHDLQKIAIDSGEGRNAVCSSGGGTVRMQVIEILAVPHDLAKLFKRVAAFRPPGFIGGQVAANNVRGRWWAYGTEVMAPSQVG